jgi:hypothetical protein
MTEKELIAHREMLQQLVTGLGRDDIGIGEVTKEEGRLVFTLTRGELSHQAELPLEILTDKDRVRAAMMAIIPKISKQIEQQHLQAAQHERKASV